jgi:hypothetical protein
VSVVLTQFVSPDDEHEVLETCRELKIKINTWKRIVRHVGHLPTKYKNKMGKVLLQTVSVISTVATELIPGLFQRCS